MNFLYLRIKKQLIILVCNPLYNSKKSFFFTNYELAVIKNVVISVRASTISTKKNFKSKSKVKNVSYHKISKVFKLSSKTIYNWVNSCSLILRKKIHFDQVNINDIASALYSRINAYRMGWIQKIDVSKILNGESIH